MHVLREKIVALVVQWVLQDELSRHERSTACGCEPVHVRI